MQLCAFMLSSSSRSRPLSFQLESNRLFLLALRSIALLVMPHLMTSKLPSGTPESARSFIGLVKILEKQLTLEDVQQLAVLSKSMKEVTTIWQKLLSDNGNVLPPEWNADEDLRNVQHRCDDTLFSEVGKALATLLTELLQVIDLDIENLTDIVQHLKNMSSTKENSNNALALEKRKLESCQSQDDIRRQSLEQLRVLRKKEKLLKKKKNRFKHSLQTLTNVRTVRSSPLQQQANLLKLFPIDALIQQLVLEFLCKNIKKGSLPHQPRNRQRQ